MTEEPGEKEEMGQGRRGVGDLHRAPKALLPLPKRQVWGKAGKEGSGGVGLLGTEYRSLEH
jgi:hypothetical protein